MTLLQLKPASDLISRLTHFEIDARSNAAESQPDFGS
jgi:hypothetical protein